MTNEPFDEENYVFDEEPEDFKDISNPDDYTEVEEE